MKNRLKELLQSGKPAIGTMVQLPNPSVVEILAQAGFDWLLIDTEHGPIDVETVHAMIRATSGTTTTPVVRVHAGISTGSPSASWTSVRSAS